MRKSYWYPCLYLHYFPRSSCQPFMPSTSYPKPSCSPSPHPPPPLFMLNRTLPTQSLDPYQQSLDLPLYHIGPCLSISLKLSTAPTEMTTGCNTVVLFSVGMSKTNTRIITVVSIEPESRSTSLQDAFARLAESALPPALVSQVRFNRCLPIFLPVRPSVYLCLSLCLSVCLFRSACLICLSVFVILSVYLSLCLSVSVHLSVYLLSVCLSSFLLFLLPICLSLVPPLC